MSDESFYDVDCPYKDRCSDYPTRCDTCRHNNNKKKSFYEPDWGPNPWRPYFKDPIHICWRGGHEYY